MNFLLIGVPGSGKTTAACSGRPPTLLVDVDGKAGEMANLKPLVKKGDLVIHAFRDKLVDDSLAYRALNPDKPPEIQPSGYLSIVTYLDKILEGESEFSGFKTISLDSLTRDVEHLTRLLVYHRGQGKFGKKIEDGDMNWPSWGSYKANLEEKVKALCSFLENKDFVCTVHQRTMTVIETLMVGSKVVEIEKIVGYKPMVDGQMRDKLAGYFNESYYMDFRVVGKQPEYRFRTRGMKYDARTSLSLNEFEKASIEYVLKKGGI